MSLDELFSKREKIDEAARRNFESVRMTYEAFEKINLYYTVIKNTINRNYECAGLLLNQQDKYDGICRDAMLIKGQSIGGAEVKFEPGAVSGAYALARKRNMKIIGPWHSHGSMGVFHSNADKGHLISIYQENRLTLPNYAPLDRHYAEFSGNDFFVAIEDGAITIKKRRQGLDKIAELEYKEPSMIHLDIRQGINRGVRSLLHVLLETLIHKYVAGIRLSSETGLAYAQSVVINDHTARSARWMCRNPKIRPKCSLRVIYQKEPFSDEFIEIDDENVELQLIDEKNGIILDENALKEEVYGSVSVGGIPIKGYGLARGMAFFPEKRRQFNQNNQKKAIGKVPEEGLEKGLEKNAEEQHKQSVGIHKNA